MSDPTDKALRALTGFVGGWRFPVFAITFLFFAAVLLLMTLAIPPADTPLSAFAEEFKRWCFGYDSATGEMEMAYVVVLLVNPAVLIVIITGVWWEPLQELRREKRRAGIWVASALAAVALAAVGLGFTWKDVAPAHIEFPAAALRTNHEPPAFAFTNQDGELVGLDQLRGRVVVLTGVYATCGYTCPMILGQAKRSLAAIPESVRDRVTFVAITLDPERDTPERMAEMARAQGVSAPAFHLVTGDADDVNRVLDRLDIARRRDPETGIIDHANLFLVVDARGRVAYRFTLSERQEQWLSEALVRLVGELEPTG